MAFSLFVALTEREMTSNYIIFGIYAMNYRDQITNQKALLASTIVATNRLNMMQSVFPVWLIRVVKGPISTGPNPKA